MMGRLTNSMMNSMMHSLMLIVALLSGCALGGTEAGNPTIQLNPAQTYHSEQILSGVCLKLTECNPGLTQATCESRSKNTAGLAEAIGATGFATYQDLISAERANTVSANTSNAVTCRADIAVLLCTSNEVLTAYDPFAANDFTNVRNIIPSSSTSCPGIF